jgi:hypothetical protein
VGRLNAQALHGVKTMKPDLFRYTAFGLGIHSFLSLPELVSGNTNADVFFRLGKINGAGPNQVGEGWGFKATSREADYFFESVGRFLVRGGQEVIVDPSPDADEQAVRLCLLGPILALLLHQRGQLILHASAVVVGGQSIIFLGGQGAGKSTIAAAFHGCGHKILTDDVTAIRMDSNCLVVLPAYPQMKLWPNSIIELGDLPEKLPRVHPNFDKRAFRMTSGFADAPVALKRIYVLSRGEHVAIESLTPQEAMMELIGHSYAARFGEELLQATGIAKHFKQCAEVVQTCDAYRFRRPASLSILHDHVSLLSGDLGREK